MFMRRECEYDFGRGGEIRGEVFAWIFLHCLECPARLVKCLLKDGGGEFNNHMWMYNKNRDEITIIQIQLTHYRIPSK